MTTAAPDLERSTAREVLAYGVERFHPQLTMACSFQKEESVLVHMLLAIEPEARVFTIDTGVLFAETLRTWRAFEERFGLRVEVFDATSAAASGDGPWTGMAAGRCCSLPDASGVVPKVAALEQALTGVGGWITGIRRDQASTRAAAPKLERDEKRGIWKLNPIADWSEKDVWRYIHEHDLPYNRLHDEGYSSIGCEPCTQAGAGREGRWAGDDKTECGLHV